MRSDQKFVCIHGHFYQPPRENAWLEVVELQDSAAPFHDWNERINFECYAPNTAARILDGKGFIKNIINNYNRISFNFGPSLLSWMEVADPQTYQAILRADKESQDRFNGHGSAIAQVHSHLIMPLANRRDKQTQVAWGVADFKHRFGRDPEGIWLAETAVDTETLEILVDYGIKFTILAPRQARSIRPLGAKEWHLTPDGSVDPRRPYLCKLPSGRTINLFFYHGDVAQAVAFEGLLNDGHSLAHRLLGAFDNNDQDQLVHIATDGESYGHHHRKGEMALASCLDLIEISDKASLTNYGDYLERFPPTYEARIHENSSWSCVHGIERWRSNCGCNTGGNPGWTQEWRRGLRSTLNWLRDELIPIYEKQAGKLINDVWNARDDYIQVVLDRSPTNIKAFVKRHSKRLLKDYEVTKLLRLLEMQRNAMLMFTSCGWFFDEISGIETNQILQYANRALGYVKQVDKTDLNQEFVQRLALAPSNIHENGASSYLNHVEPAKVDLVRVAMHYAVSSLFIDYPEKLEFFNYRARSEVIRIRQAGNYKLVVGRAQVQSRITLSIKRFTFAVIYLGQQNIIGNIALNMDRQVFDKMADETLHSFQSSNLGEVIGLMQRYFGSEKYTIWHLFRDEKRKILRQITDQNLEKVSKSFREIYNENYLLMTGMLQSNIPIPEAYNSAVQFVVNQDLHSYFSNGSFENIRELRRLVEEFRKWNIKFSDQQSLTLAISERIYEEILSLDNGGLHVEKIEHLNEVLESLGQLGLDVNAWKSQNFYLTLLEKFRNAELVIEGPETLSAFFRLGHLLHIRSEAA